MAKGKWQIHFACECGSSFGYSGLKDDPTRKVLEDEIQRHAELGHEPCTPEEAKRIRNSEAVQGRNRNRYRKRPAWEGKRVWNPRAAASKGKAVAHLVQLNRWRYTLCGTHIGDTWLWNDEDGEDVPPAECTLCLRSKA